MNTFIKRILPIAILALLFSGCQKTEFMPPAEGEKIPYNTGVNKDLNAVLSESPSKIFYAAWQRSTIADALKTGMQYTVLAPSDAAMQGAGYTAAAISNMAVNDVDSLVAFYTISNKVTKADLLLRNSNFEGMSLHTRADLSVQDGVSVPNTPYHYRHYLGIDNDKLMINGLISGDANSGAEATNGYVFQIDRMIAIPTRGFMGVLEADARFSMFVEVQRRADEEHNKVYNALYMENYGFEPGDDYNRKYYPNILNLVPGQVVSFQMLFAPTNDAFKAAGFNSVEEVLEWNKRATPMIFDWNIGSTTDAGFPSDTVLNYHWEFGRENQPYTNQGKAPGGRPTTFYANDLRDDLLGNYLINYYPGYVNYHMPYTFSKNGSGQVQMQVKGSTAAPATILETINTLTGPIHVVDRLLIPKDFKMK
ncbi:fasciclin domain-containing protein [Mucilaginibacter sp. JRF]|uniref:fasciclin domain-containing protein n=1 Tax=Mucilaginibacter sp. JRF TaxID=2780088 RepID=UPI00188083C5|nr:fasciclin domain-containing protein [Mucilaginibacter sp. JRF]MBE9586223.1 fasciclin domain-containing protein [Mucilaginibacter sp. JRF]